MTILLDAFRNQWVKLRRPTLLGWTYLALTLLAGLFTVIVFARAGAPGRGDFVTLNQLAAPNGLAKGLDRAAPLLGIVAFGIAAAQIAIEFSGGTIRQLLVRQPRRNVLLAGEAVAIITFLFGAVVLAAVGGGVAALIMAQVRHIPTAAWTSSTGLADQGRALGDIALSVVGYVVLGILVGMIVRAPAPAVIIGFVYLLPLENLFAAIVPSAQRWLPGQLLVAISQGGGNSLGFRLALSTSVVYALAASVIAGLLFTRRDVTA